ncbi:MAG: ATP-dependent Clp protease ATP-binding subunit [Clostridia bacterium]|nr:ATP-dependent Clp protease ATP-binding subunit [Clostridia bacterium]
MFECQLTENAKNVVAQAGECANLYHAEAVGTEHLLYGLFKVYGSVAERALRTQSVTLSQYDTLLPRGNANVRCKGSSERLNRVLDLAGRLSQSIGVNYIGTEHLLFALLSQSCMACSILQQLGVDIKELRKTLSEQIYGTISQEKRTSLQKEGSADSFAGQEVRPSSLEDGEESSLQNALKKLEKYGYNLSARAKAGKLDPVIGRSKEIDRIVQILCRRTKNNPILIGEPGVGKSAVIEGLALAIAEGNVPPSLKQKQIFSLDLASMLAGTRYRGDFEERIKEMLDCIREQEDILLFIDEIHNLVGAGATMNDKMDAAEMLKPMLARGELQTIGATTIDEYRKYFEKDPALARRFQSVVVEQPDVHNAALILKGLRERYEKHHGVRITDGALRAAAEMSDRYITDRFLPDKAIDLIDEAASRARLDTVADEGQITELRLHYAEAERRLQDAFALGNNEQAYYYRKAMEEISERLKQMERPVVGEEEVAKVVAQWTGIPVNKLTESDTQKLMNLESSLHARVIGQNEAVCAVSKAIRRSRAGLGSTSRPIGSFLFVGPTGVGKTELCKALAAQLFGDEKQLIRLDMSEYMEKHSCSKLIGAPPGYVGYDDASGQLSEPVRRKPYSVVLLDEIEKAHPDVFDILLQVLDDGHLTDSRGRQVNFRNAVVIMTSNAGAAEMMNYRRVGFEPTAEEDARGALQAALKKQFRPEFLNRIDEIIVFHPLAREDIRHIAEIMLRDLFKKLSERGITLCISEEAMNYLIDQGYDAEYGARPLRRVIQRQIEDRLSEEILSGTVHTGDRIRIDLENSKILFNRVESGL